MANKMTIPPSEVRVGDMLFDGVDHGFRRVTSIRPLTKRVSPRSSRTVTVTRIYVATLPGEVVAEIPSVVRMSDPSCTVRR